MFFEDKGIFITKKEYIVLINAELTQKIFKMLNIRATSHE